MPNSKTFVEIKKKALKCESFDLSKPKKFKKSDKSIAVEHKPKSQNLTKDGNKTNSNVVNPETDQSFGNQLIKASPLNKNASSINSKQLNDDQVRLDNIYDLHDHLFKNLSKIESTRKQKYKIDDNEFLIKSYDKSGTK